MSADFWETHCGSKCFSQVEDVFDGATLYRDGEPTREVVGQRFVQVVDVGRTLVSGRVDRANLGGTEGLEQGLGIPGSPILSA
jgi:hypothetical protein